MTREEFKVIREFLGLSSVGFGRQTGYNAAYIRHVESGVAPMTNELSCTIIKLLSERNASERLATVRKYMRIQ